jgi:3-dehydroquinate synthase
MRTLAVKDSKLGDYNVVISDRAIDEMEKHIKAHHAKANIIFVIYDPSVRNAEHLIRYDRFDNAEVVFIALPKKKSSQPAEDIKNWSTVTNLIQNIFAYGANKNSVVIALGGGVTTDIVGFISTIVCRGINFIYCPSTLTCGVDGCIGGETGINYKSSIIGTFGNPNAVFIDLRLLKTLSTMSIQDGLCECIKHALVYDEGLFHFIVENTERIYTKKNKVLEELIYRSLSIKKSFLEDNLYDKKIALSLGHTVCDALELKHRFGRRISLPLGIIVACRVANEMSLLSDEILNEIEILMSTHFNIIIETGRAIHKDVTYVMQTIKKQRGLKAKQGIKMVLPVAIGQVEIRTVEPQLLSKVLHSVFSE